MEFFKKYWPVPAACVINDTSVAANNSAYSASLNKGSSLTTCVNTAIGRRVCEPAQKSAKR